MKCTESVLAHSHRDPGMHCENMSHNLGIGSMLFYVYHHKIEPGMYHMGLNHPIHNFGHLKRNSGRGLKYILSVARNRFLCMHCIHSSLHNSYIKKSTILYY